MEIDAQTAALVTGAGSGIGRALAIALARRGARVAVVARSDQALREVAAAIESAGGSALAIACDVTDRAATQAAVHRTIERFGRLDVLVNNAGSGHMGFIENTPEDDIEQVFRVNVFALWYATAPAVRQMRRQGSGCVVTISSIAGKIGYPANAAYVAAKHAAVGFNRALRAELAGTGIEAIVVLPAGTRTSWVQTAGGDALARLFRHESVRGDELADEMHVTPFAAIPLLEPEAVAEAIVEGILHPVPELYTHPGTRERVAAYDADQRRAEHRLAPYWIANREGYLQLVADGSIVYNGDAASGDANE